MDNDFVPWPSTTDDGASTSDSNRRNHIMVDCCNDSLTKSPIRTKQMGLATITTDKQTETTSTSDLNPNQRRNPHAHSDTCYNTKEKEKKNTQHTKSKGSATLSVGTYLEVEGRESKVTNLTPLAGGHPVHQTARQTTKRAIKVPAARLAKKTIATAMRTRPKKERPFDAITVPKLVKTTKPPGKPRNTRNTRRHSTTKQWWRCSCGQLHRGATALNNCRENHNDWKEHETQTCLTIAKRNATRLSRHLVVPWKRIREGLKFGPQKILSTAKEDAVSTTVKRQKHFLHSKQRESSEATTTKVVAPSINKTRQQGSGTTLTEARNARQRQGHKAPSQNHHLTIRRCLPTKEMNESMIALCVPNSTKMKTSHRPGVRICPTWRRTNGYLTNGILPCGIPRYKLCEYHPTYLIHGILPYGISRYKTRAGSCVTHLAAYLCRHTARPPGWVWSIFMFICLRSYTSISLSCFGSRSILMVGCRPLAPNSFTFLRVENLTV